MKALFKLMLKGSLVGAMSLVVAAGCSDSDKNDDSNAGGDSNSGGSSAGTKNDGGSKSDAGDSNGTAGVGGGGASTEGGGGANEGGTGGADPFAQGGAGGVGGAGYTGPAIAKFCNSLTFGTKDAPMPTTFRLEVGEGDAMVTFTATTGECVPADGDACTEIPTGDDVLVQLFDVDNDAEPVDFAAATIAEDKQYVFTTELDTVVVDQQEEAVPVWSVLAVKPAVACEDVTYADLP